mmetsp:Transcript_59091/g.105055  ORF Transcript_59091/g.105055 Transcript_59091/m.105055 type:complete len:1015 (-) Transcript_59091:136-3180(-)
MACSSTSCGHTGAYARSLLQLEVKNSEVKEIGTASWPADTSAALYGAFLLMETVAIAVLLHWILNLIIARLKTGKFSAGSSSSESQYDPNSSQKATGKCMAEPAVEVPGCPPEATLLNALSPVSGQIAIRNKSGTSWSYLQLKEIISSKAWGRFAKYERCALILPPGDEIAVALLCLMARTSVVPLDPSLSKEEFGSALQQLNVDAVLLSPSSPATDAANDLGLPIYQLTASNAMLLPVAVGTASAEEPSSNSERWKTASDVTLLLRTSGTTGKSKIVPLQLGQLIYGAKCIASSIGLSSDDVCLNAMPLFHIGGISCNLLAPLVSGGTVVCLEAFQPDVFLTALSTEKPTWYYASPTIHLSLAESAESTVVTNLRLIRSGAAALSPVLQQRLEDIFKCTVLATYSMSECMPIASPLVNKNIDAVRCQPLGSVGRPIGPCVEIRDGEVMLRGPLVMKSYEGGSGWTEEGLFPTGDLGEIDSEGFLWLRGRKKEIINRGGETLAPQEIEDIAKGHPHVREAAAYAVPHSLLGEAVGMAICLNCDDNAFQIAQDIAKQFSSKLRPSVITLVSALPRTATGKVQRLALHRWLRLSSLPLELDGQEKSLCLLDARGSDPYKPATCHYLGPEPGTVSSIFTMDSEEENGQLIDSLGLASSFSKKKGFELQTLSYMYVIGVLGINFSHLVAFTPVIFFFDNSTANFMSLICNNRWHMELFFAGAAYFDAKHNPELNVRDLFMIAMVAAIPILFKPLTMLGDMVWCDLEHPARWFFCAIVAARIYVVLSHHCSVPNALQVALAWPYAKAVLMVESFADMSTLTSFLLASKNGDELKVQLSILIYILSFNLAPRLVELAAVSGPQTKKTERFFGAICWFFFIAWNVMMLGLTEVKQVEASGFQFNEERIGWTASLLIVPEICLLTLATAYMPPSFIPQIACDSLLGSVLLLPLILKPGGDVVLMIPKVPILGASSLGQAVALIFFMAAVTCVCAPLCQALLLGVINCTAWGVKRLLDHREVA